MHRRHILAAAGAVCATAALALAMVFAGGVGVTPPSATSSVSFVDACGPAAAGFARCHAIVRVGPNRHVNPTPTPTSSGGGGGGISCPTNPGGGTSATLCPPM